MQVMPARAVGITALFCLLPIFELRGAIPYGMAQDLPLLFLVPFCIILNALVGPLVYLFLSTAHKMFAHLSWYSKLFDSAVIRARSKVQAKVDKYGYLGLALFVAIPLPITGAYTGTLGAWVLGMDPKKTFLAVALGVIISGTVVTIVAFLGIEALSLFIKQVHA
jgi:uncharacterized membrane protein